MQLYYQLFGILAFVVTLFSSAASAQATYPWATPISRTGWLATADSFQTTNNASQAIDNQATTFWHSQYTPTVAALPHYLQVDMLKSYVVNGLSYQPRQDKNVNGNIAQHTITLSNDGTTWSNPVAFGGFLSDNGTTKYTFFSYATARYVRLTAQSEASGQQFSSIAELYVYSPDVTMNAATFVPPVPSSQGRWGATLDMPISPAAGFITKDNIVVLFAAFRPDLFTSGTGQTETVEWVPGSQAITRYTVTNTAHDMFCPGMSTDASGAVIVTGGNDNLKTSKYNPATGAWATAAHMTIGRGYQSSTLIADGRTFTIGGSWSGPLGGKNGEIYNSTTNVWTSLPGCLVAPMLTADAEGIFRRDNHAWLFAWKQNSVFQAGPSAAMNWYNATGTAGAYTAAGKRASSPDSMCGIATMYDAVKGLVLTAGGSPDYKLSNATSLANIVQLGDAYKTPTVTKTASMSYARSFANGVVLPDGQVLVTGGQSYANPFTDTTAAMPAELFNPADSTWKVVAPIPEARTYHSWAILLPDATVLNGGGGLCGVGCLQNHFTAQVWSPPYLYNADNTLATRPVISSASPLSLQPGGTLTVTLAGTGNVTFSMIRYGSATHTVNTDQRRVPLTSVAGSTSGTYTMILPSDAGVMLPGIWMLFVITSAGVPSVATQITVLLP